MLAPATRAAAVLAIVVLASTAAARELTPRERAGRRIYFEGRTGSGGELRAFLGAGTPVSAAALTCASCHGEDGLGRPEGGVVPPAITWSELGKPYGHVHAGRVHPAFDARSLVRAVTEGVDPAGNALGPAMPRYSLSRADAESLVAYLRVLERDASPGLSPSALRVATLLPVRGPLAEAGAAMRRVLEASFARINASGGIHGRRLELAVAGYDPEGERPVEALRRLVAKDPPFALVSGLAPGAEEEVAEVAERERLPLVAPFGAAPPSASAGRYTFYALAGLRDQARVLARYAARERDGAGSRIAVLHAASGALAAAAHAAAAELSTSGIADAALVPFDAGGPGRGLVERLARGGVGQVLFLGADADLRAFTARAGELRFAPRLLAPGMLVARAAAGAPPSFEGRIFLVYPSLPGGERPGAREAFEDLRRTAGIKDRDRTAQIAALTAAELLQEGLRRAGRAVTRERLVDALEALFRFDTGLVPPLTFGPARRVGAAGGLVFAVDPRRRTFTPASGWIAVE